MCQLPVSLVPKDCNKLKGPDNGKHEQWDTVAEEPTLDSGQAVLSSVTVSEGGREVESPTPHRNQGKR